MSAPTPSEPVVNAMSVDVEDYFHVSAFAGAIPRHAWSSMESRVVENTRRMLDLFDEFNVRATFFVLGWVARHHPHLVPEIVTRGHELASHGYEHRLIYEQTPDEFRQDVRTAKTLLEDQGGVEVGGYRAPSFSVTARSIWALEILLEEGHRYDASIFPIRHDRYGIPDAPRHTFRIPVDGDAIVEVPASTVRLGSTNLPVSGGGYFRILPYRWTHWGIAHVNRVERRPTVFYIHPWEIDPGQPRIKARLLSRFRHYYNLGATERRLRLLLRDFEFGPIRTLVESARSAKVAELVPARVLAC